MQKRCNSTANTMELHLFCIKLSKGNTTIGSDNGMSLVRRQAIFWSNADLSEP